MSLYERRERIISLYFKFAGFFLLLSNSKYIHAAVLFKNPNPSLHQKHMRKKSEELL